MRNKRDLVEQRKQWFRIEVARFVSAEAGTLKFDGKEVFAGQPFGIDHLIHLEEWKTKKKSKHH